MNRYDFSKSKHKDQFEKIKPGQTWRSKQHVSHRLEIIDKDVLREGIQMWSVWQKDGGESSPAHLNLPDTEIHERYILDKTKPIIKMVRDE